MKTTLAVSSMRARLEEFALSLHPAKTRLIEFGRYAAAADHERRGLGKSGGDGAKAARFAEKAGDGVGAVADAELRRGPRASKWVYALQHGRYQNPFGFPNSQAKDCVMDGPTIAFFVIGLAIVALFLILMIEGD